MVADDTTDVRRDVLPRILKSIHWQTKQSNHEVMLNRSHGKRNITAPLDLLLCWKEKSSRLPDAKLAIAGFAST